MTRLLLVRHGESEYNSARRFAGHVDIGLTEGGLRQVERLRERLSGEKIDAVYCSDLRRAQLTAERLIEGRGLSITTCPELREISYGEIEGLAFSEIQQKYPELAKQIRNFDLEMAFPGGETFMEFVRRVETFKERLANHAESDSVLVVAHGGPLRALLCSLLGIGQTCWWQLRVDNASLSIVETFPSRADSNSAQPAVDGAKDSRPRRAILGLLNETHYLKEAGTPSED